MSGSYAWARSSSLSLPLPIAVPATSVFHPVISALLIPLAATTFRNRYKNAAVLSGAISYILTLTPVVLLTLALIYSIPSQLSSCSLESQWKYLFRTKNADAVRAIQGTLRCCGLNSMHDRAWPFQGNGIDAKECERTQGWKVRCLDGWMEQQARTANLVAVACVLNWAFVVSTSFKKLAKTSIAAYNRYQVLLAYIARNRLPWTRQEGRGQVNGDLFSRLLGHDGEAAAVDRRRRQIAEVDTYTDDAEGDAGQEVDERADDDEETSGAVHISSLHR